MQQQPDSEMWIWVSDMLPCCPQFCIFPLGFGFLMQNSYVFLEKTLKNSVGWIILLPVQLYREGELLCGKQNEKEGGWQERGEVITWARCETGQRWREYKETKKKGSHGAWSYLVRTGLKTSNWFWEYPKSPAFNSGSWNLWLNFFPLNPHDSTTIALKTWSLFCTILWPFLEDSESLLLDNTKHKRNPVLFFFFFWYK